MRIAIIASLGAAFLLTNAGFASEGPRSAEVRVPNSAPRDRPFPGEIQLSVDASDINRRIVHVHEVITGLERGARLLYPKWIPGGHAPEGTIDRLSGMRFTSGGKALAWKRDPLDMYAFIPELPKEAASLEVDFDYLSPTSGKVGDQEISHEILTLEWIAVVIYPDGYYARQIPVHTNLTLPPGWKYASALEEEGSSAGRIVFKTLSLEKLIDSPFYAGTYNLRLDLDPQGPKPVHLNIFADRPELLDVKPEQLAVHRALIQQAYKLFGSNHYDHYDFLLSISDYVHEQGTEHHQSSEDGTGPGYFTEWKKYSYDRGLLPHEYAHSWNGKFRRPLTYGRQTTVCPCKTVSCGSMRA
jgi:predicted metalloprotease with PDZ domain